MSTPELPPLKLPALPSLPSRSLADHERYIIELREVMKCRERLLEARERILLARIAELEADAERLDSGRIVFLTRDIYGEPARVTVAGVDLRAAIDAARNQRMK